DLGALLEGFFSRKPLGCIVEKGRTVFRVFAPRAHAVRLVLFHKHDALSGEEYDMQRAADGTWEVSLAGELWGKYYGYKVAGPQAWFEKFQPEQVIADPYSKAVCTQSTYLHEAKSIIIKTDEYDWEGDTPLTFSREDLVIYEMHVRDMTAHRSSGVREKGTYRGLVEPGTVGGLNHILELGVNAVELLPCQEFANVEPPFGVEVNGVKNTWNPYARNHWGYMTTYFFSPESYYASGGNLVSGEYSGIEGRQVGEFKDMVKSFHRAGIAVIMDVVYNHVSQYDRNPFKYIDKQYYFRLDSRLAFLNQSGCGNDFKTERPMARRMIVDSVKYWLREYHIDGFRFDLAALIDQETLEQITEEARKINPNVLLIAEPWGGNQYNLAGFSDLGWSAWNDMFRNGVKGENPLTGHGWIFGTYWGGDNAEAVRNYVRGTLRAYGGPFRHKTHSVNYLESHDGYTLGDFIRIGSGEVDPEARITDIEKNARVSPEQERLNKLAALFLLTSQGVVMLHEGQEFARSKVIAATDAPDPLVGLLDHDSYNKDNETNWLDFHHKELNRGLFDYYRGLVALRRTRPEFRKAKPEAVQFLETETELALGYVLEAGEHGRGRVVVLLNADAHQSARFSLPQGVWRTLVDGSRAGVEPFGRPRRRSVSVKPRSGLVLVAVA
ncbi:MAG: DUF3459 domain-containing protein, partial [Calditrichaeota bacterium]